MENILIKKEGNIAIISLNRPKALNAFNSQMHIELTAAIKEINIDPDIYVIILNSNIDKAFTAGGDIKEEAQLTYDTAYDFAKVGQDCIMAIYNSAVPVIAAVDEYALGGGLEIILAADITVASKTAKIGIPTINLGGIPCWAGTQLLPRVVGYSRACDILLTGRTMSAEECYQLNLIEYVTEKENLMDTAIEIANTIADKSPHAISMMRKAIKEGIKLPLEDSLELERQIFKNCYTSSDRTEATAAFLEKRSHKSYNNRSFETDKHK